MISKLSFAAVVLLISGQVHAVLVQGPGFITASTDILPCATTICGPGLGIAQIADGISVDGPFNGFAGLDDQIGIISLDLLGDFDLQSFTLWNDINVNREGVDTFKLHFFDASDNLIQSSSILNAPIGQFAPQTYSFASIIQSVSKVDLETLTLLTGGVGSRIEIREVAFNGEIPSAVPVPAAIWLFGTALIGLVGFGKQRKAA